MVEQTAHIRSVRGPSPFAANVETSLEIQGGLVLSAWYRLDFPQLKTYSEPMRLFYALTFDEQTLRSLSQIQDTIQPLLLKGRRTAISNLHLTLSFLGEQDPKLLANLTKVLQKLPSDPIFFEFSQLGMFTKPGGNIIWLGITKSQQIRTLQSHLVSMLKELPVQFTDTPFTEHVTLYRNAHLTSLPTTTRLNCSIQAIRLMHSHQVQGVLTYTPISSNYLSEK